MPGTADTSLFLTRSSYLWAYGRFLLPKLPRLSCSSAELTPLMSVVPAHSPPLLMPPGSVSSRRRARAGSRAATWYCTHSYCVPPTPSPHCTGSVQFCLPKRLWGPLGHLTHLCSPGLWHRVGVGKSPLTQSALCAHTFSEFRQALCVSRDQGAIEQSGS